MYKGKKIAVVIPAYNEQRLIIPTLGNVPKFFDNIYVVNDGSSDATEERVAEYRARKKDKRIKIINHGRNRGLGQSIITGYKVASKEENDIIFVVGGDFQMDLSEAEKFLLPLVHGEADFVKGNRFLYSKQLKKEMPLVRLVGNSLLSLMTKFASGYWKIFDSNDGYTAITKEALDRVDWEKASRGYGYNGDWQALFNIANIRIKDVPRRPIYLKGERQSQIKIFKYIIKVAPRLMRRFFWRIRRKYLSLNFHPLALFYLLGMILLPLGFLVGAYLIWEWFAFYPKDISGTKAILSAMFIIMGAQFLLFAILLDVQDNERLQP